MNSGPLLVVRLTRALLRGTMGALRAFINQNKLRMLEP